MARKRIIKVAPSQEKRVEIRRKRKPRKTHEAQVKIFNRMVEEGKISGLKFNNFGELVGAENRHGQFTEDEKEAIRLVQLTLMSRARYTALKPEYFDLNTKWNNFLQKHGEIGGFEYIHEAIEIPLLGGGSAMEIIRGAEIQNGKQIPALREVVSRFNTRTKVNRNLVRELRYFERLLKEKKQKEMIIAEEESQWDKGRVIVKITDKGVLRQSLTIIKAPPYGQVITTVLLKPDNKIELHDASFDR